MIDKLMNNIIEILGATVLKGNAKISSFSQPTSGNEIALNLRTTAGVSIKFDFEGVILFIFRQGIFSRICLNNENNALYQIAVQRTYKSLCYPAPTHGKLIQFMDDNNQIVIEVIADKFNYKII